MRDALLGILIGGGGLWIVLCLVVWADRAEWP